MNFFDQLLASGYYAFDGKLNSHIVRIAIAFLRKNNMKFKSKELVMQKIKKYMYFDIETQHYLLYDEYTVGDLSEFMDIDLITLFHNIKLSRDRYYSGLDTKEEPTFESAMENNNIKGM